LPPKLAHQHFGQVLLSCDEADLRPTPFGIEILTDGAREFEALEAPRVPRTEVIDELCAAVLHDRPPLHTGEWGRATTEVCLAIIESAARRADVLMKHQVGVPRHASGALPR
jgi:phthalate 4,5-cis-dihydrodiol dehydrogenase